MSLSILIPAYNCEETIGKCIESALSLRVESKVVIVSDNASTDRTPILLKEYEKAAIIYYQKSNIGLIENWKFLLQKSDANYVMFLGADDYICVNKEFFLKLEASVYLFPTRRIYDGDEQNFDYYRPSKQILENSIMERQLFSEKKLNLLIGSSICKKDIWSNFFRSIRSFERGTSLDRVFVLMLLNAPGRKVFLEDLEYVKTVSNEKEEQDDSLNESGLGIISRLTRKFHHALKLINIIFLSVSVMSSVLANLVFRREISVRLAARMITKWIFFILRQQYICYVNGKP